MKRLPQERIMTVLLKEDKVDKKTIDEIAEIVAEFHSKAQTNPEISEFGSLKIVKTNWDENFAQTNKIHQPNHSPNRIPIHPNQNQRFHAQKQSSF